MVRKHVFRFSWKVLTFVFLVCIFHLFNYIRELAFLFAYFFAVCIFHLFNYIRELAFLVCIFHLFNYIVRSIVDCMSPQPIRHMPVWWPMLVYVLYLDRAWNWTTSRLLRSSRQGLTHYAFLRVCCVMVVIIADFSVSQPSLFYNFSPLSFIGFRCRVWAWVSVHAYFYFWNMLRFVAML